MVKYSATRLDRTFAALAHPIRRRLVSRLKEGELAIHDLAEPFAVSLPAILKHVAVLEQAGLLTRQKRGRVNFCRLAAGPLKDAAAWLAAYQQFWDERLDELESYIQTVEPGEDQIDELAGQDDPQA